MDGSGDDPFDSLTKLCVLSDSQEDTLRRCSFAGDRKSIRDFGSLYSQFFHFQPTSVSMAPLPERLEQREQIAYQAPPEQRSTAVDDPSLADAATVVEGVDLGKNSDLGFHSEVQSTQQTAEIEILGVRRREISESEAGGEGGSAAKRLKLSKEVLGTTSSVPIDLDSEESEDEKPNYSLMDILKILSEREKGKEDKIRTKTKILKILWLKGVTFTRPCWWPEGWDFSFK